MSTNQVAVVTGAGSGIGQAISELLADDYLIVGVDLNSKTLQKVGSDINSSGRVFHQVVGDVSHRQVHMEARKIASELGELVAWVNCAGWTRSAKLHEFPDDSKVFEELIAANQHGTFWGCSEAVSHFVEKKIKGRIVNISSVHGRRAWRDHAVYEMTKAAVDALTRNVAVTYGPYGIRCNSVAPGAVMTPALKKSFEDSGAPEVRQASLEMMTPLKRIAQPAEIADVVRYLLSENSSYISGQSLAVEGGWTSALGAIDLDSELADEFGLDQKTGLPKSSLPS